MESFGLSSMVVILAFVPCVVVPVLVLVYLFVRERRK